ncbi:MAG: hypothetical protein IKE61_01775, partial [Coriobacteriales bacterium]|nr:hypothetical protein [Coriobacteriales bacterium]
PRKVSVEKDLAEGKLTMDDAQEIVDAFFLKANCFYGGGARFVTETTGVGNTYQHTTLGGVKPEDGEDATNPVTYMVLETVGRLKLHDPTISLRFNKNSPAKLWECAIATSKLVGGLPLYQNDEVIIPGLIENNGFELEDARDYAFIGCQEVVGCGNDYPCGNGCPPPNSGLRYNVIITMAINDGINPMNGHKAKIGFGKLGDMKSMEEVKEAYRQMVLYFTRWSATMNNFTDVIQPTITPLSMLSMSIDGCMEKGKDIVAGGAKYNSIGGTATGLATVADSLSTIEYLVFDKKICTGDELLQAVLDNWEGHEELRQIALNEVPHFGNADPYADKYMKFVLDVYLEAVGSVSIARTDIYKAGMYGAADHVVQGRSTWATPDGRKTGEPTADAMSPAQTRDKNGPMAIFNSMKCFDHTKFMDGMALNIRIHPSAIANEEGANKLAEATQQYFADGGMEVQYNVVSSDTLREAQKHPEDYRDLVVRIAGYSAYFVEMTEDLQNDIISRNENSI